ncbi:hypothetical protein KY495_09640 [Massilia sp. PAMC28688]|uniref:hypothetical protein n=1 Tax=Massilia sp. PAMC28688 TaxID=2861283 RepID=UPI001C62A857|nr:hypothetical protein [Massilia sp. PAMC28688]QYF95383.1 hypothetical protein KY495_09640 [Massilia sp. PAMC28688]
MQMQLFCAALACALVVTDARAAEKEKSPEEIKRGIVDAVRRYANAISCPGVKVRTDDALALIPVEDDERMLPKYVVLWSGDLGCFGGAGIEATHLAVATISSGKYIVDPRLSSPVVTFESPVRFVKRVVSYTPDSMTLQGNVFGPQDRRDPSIPVRFTVKVDDKGNWIMTDKRVLPLGTAGG